MEVTMGKFWMLLLLMMAVPVHAAETSAAIPLRYLPAGDLERFLLPGDALRTGSLVLPAGLLAWTVDARQNTITVTGSDDAIQALKEAIRILDVPPIHIQVAVRRLRADDPAVTALAPLPPAGAKDAPHGVLLSPEQSTALEARPAVESATLDTNNNVPVRLKQTGAQGRSLSLVTVVPRVNGDDTVTLMVSISEAAGEAGAGASPVVTLARVPAGRAVLVVPGTAATVLMIRARPIITPAVPPTAAP
jgi:Bacterial type II/III secretion system short domain